MKETTMNRRKFLTGAAAGAAGFGGRGPGAGPQTPGGPAGGQAPAAGRQGGGGGRGRGFGAAPNVPADKLARVSIMTLDFSQYRPSRTGAPPATGPVLESIFDFPKMYV